jgi:opacity protein-like surface antigen
MKKPLVGVMVLLAGAWTISAQELNMTRNSADDGTNVASEFAETSAAHVNLLSASRDATEARSFAEPAAASALPGDPGAAATPAANPRWVFGDRDDYRWQLAVGVEFFRFRSNVISASMPGLNTTVTYYTNDWFGVEGNIVTGFAPEIYDREHVKYFGVAGGIHVGSRRARWEPWAHALFGLGHLQPQTAFGSRNTFAITAGGGVDYRIFDRLSLRGEADYVYTRFFSETQNDFQATVGVVVHF